LQKYEIPEKWEEIELFAIMGFFSHKIHLMTFILQNHFSLDVH
jgi:hypothetical protein